MLATGLLIVAGAVSLVVGNGQIGFDRVGMVLLGGADEYAGDVVAARISRTVMGAVVGAALAVSGVLIQGVTRNPLGEPGLLGVTMGASASVVTATALFGFTGGFASVWVALPGAVLAVAVTYLLGRQSGSESVIPLVLAGAVVSAVLGAYVQAMILVDPTTFDSYRHWVVGSLAGADFDTLRAVLPALLLGVVLAWVCTSGLNSVALGEDVAVALGVPVARVRLGSIAGATLLAAGATAAVGPIAFVGLAVPHLVRALVGADHRAQLPVALVLGAAVLVASDVAARLVAWPQELMVGVVTAFVGAPFLLAAVRRGKVTT
ncbi:FecCD family ABC transporter permease [Nocardioides insulae]|uniref:FecCD family ABC transporter permease n=1 Tax=Nocardioides insulae TaxID=394734 RepID=UPI000419F5DE|nr:iron ABC transporter permease [Nocardioides insulae]